MMHLKKVILPITDDILEFLEDYALNKGLIPEDADVVGVSYSLSDVGDIKDLGLKFVIRPDNVEVV